MNPLFRAALSSTALKNVFKRVFVKPGRPLYLSVCVHTEKIQDDETFGGLLELGRALPFRACACVMTPANPFIRADMEKRGLSEAVFISRLKALDEFFDIGYHGHWCRQGGGSPSAGTEIERAGFSLTFDDPEALKEQFREEYDWLSANLYPPEFYSAGWWVMNPSVAGLLAEKGFKADCSLRRNYADTFGRRALEETLMPENGVPFELPGAEGVTELPSVFYLHMNWWTVARELFPLLSRTGGPYFAVLPTHDYNLKEELHKVLDNVRLLSGVRGVRFVSLRKMNELARSGGPLFGSGGFKPVPCPACGAAPSRTVWRERSLRAAECAACGPVRITPQPPGPEGLYGESYYRNNYLPSAEPRLAFFRAKLAEIETLAPRKGELLDVGSGPGFFLKAAAERGWQARGVEPSPFAAAYARKEFSLRVDAALPANGAFDLITLWDVIAHLDSPADHLRKVYALTRDGGLLAVAAPLRPRGVFSFASFLSRFITSSYYLHVPQQLFHFTRASLERLLEKEGFKPVASAYSGLAVKTSILSVFKGSPRDIASKILHLAADRFHYHDYLVVYARKEPKPLRKKILFIAHSITGGGSEKRLASILEGLDRERFEPLLCLFSGTTADAPAGIPVRVLKPAGRPASLFLAAQLYGLIREVRPRKVFSVLWSVNVIAAAAAALAGVPAVLNEATTPSESVKRYSFPAIRRKLISFFYSRAQAVVTVSSYARADLERNFGVPAARIVTVHNGLDAGRLREAAAEYDPGVAGHVLACGGLNWWKNYGLLIKALAGENRKLVILGEGPMKDVLRREAAAAGVSLDLPGHKENPYPYFAKAAALVLASRYEGFPNVLLEAMACGTPVIAVDCPGGIREIIEDGVSGLIVPQDDPAALKEALKKVMSDRALAGRLAAAGKSRLLERFSFKKMLAGYAAVLES